MHFAALPPEVNSACMYSGPGSQPMMSAAAAWDRLAAQLHDIAAQYRSAITKLQATAPHSNLHGAWLDAAAGHAEETAARARSAAGAYESALEATVPPVVILANRLSRKSLLSTNCLGRNAPAIADADAEYERMWTRDADALYAYAIASAEAAKVTPFTPPSATAAIDTGRSWALNAAPEVMSAGRHVMSAITEALHALASSPLNTSTASLSPVTTSLSKLSSLSAPSDFAIKKLNCLNKEASLRAVLVRPVANSGAAFRAAVGRATSVGTLSVPPAWPAAATPSPVTEEPQCLWAYQPIRLVKSATSAVE